MGKPQCNNSVNLHYLHARRCRTPKHGRVWRRSLPDSRPQKKYTQYAHGALSSNNNTLGSSLLDCLQALGAAVETRKSADSCGINQICKNCTSFPACQQAKSRKPHIHHFVLLQGTGTTPHLQESTIIE